MYKFFILLMLVSFAVSDLPATETNGKANPIIARYSHNPDEWPALHYAILMKHFDIAHQILELYPEQALQSTPPVKVVYVDENNPDSLIFKNEWENGVSALELAVRSGNLKLVEHLLKLGANVRQTRLLFKGVYSYSGLPLSEGSIDARDATIPTHEIADMAFPEFDSGLSWLIPSISLPTPPSFFAERVKISEENSIVEMPSIIYWARKNRSMVDLLLQYGASEYDTMHPWEVYSYMPPIKLTNLQEAARNASDETLRELIYQQALHPVYPLNRPMLWTGSIEDISDEMVLTYRTYLQMSNLPPLFNAMSVNDLDAFQLMLDLGEDPYSRGNARQTYFVNGWYSHHFRGNLIYHAARHSNPTFVKTLDHYINGFPYVAQANNMDLFVELSAIHTPGSGELSDVARFARNDMARLILASAYSPDYENVLTPIVVHDGNMGLLEMILEYGYSGKGAFTLAVRAGKKKIVSFLLSKGVQFDDEDFYYAVDLPILKMLLKVRPIPPEILDRIMQRSQYQEIRDFLKSK